jgi:hypothetical protein
METRPSSEKPESFDELLERVVADGRFPEPGSRRPPFGANADWDELLTGENVQQRLIRKNMVKLGILATKTETAP